MRRASAAVRMIWRWMFLFTIAGTNKSANERDISPIYARKNSIRVALNFCLPYTVAKTSGFSEMQQTKRLPLTEFSEIYNRKINFSHLSRNIQLQGTCGPLHL
jgi:hypothetical protein